MDIGMKIKNPYQIFSKVYDNVMSHINFQSWANFIQKSTKPSHINSILDLGCGTGSLLYHLEGDTKIGLDSSPEMLEIAKNKCPNCSFEQGSLGNFNLKQKFDLIVCTHDTLNYLDDIYSIQDHFKIVHSHLNPGGYYFFDISSEHNLTNNFDNQTIQHSEDNISLIWENQYNSTKKEIVSTLQFFEHSENGTESFSEIHTQRYYTISEIKNSLKIAGLHFLKSGSDYKSWTVYKDCSLITFLTQKK
jgi:SAM-dependent methyltransferase